MGIYDREYYREKTRGSGWLSGSAPVCKAIIAANVGLFLFGMFLHDVNLLERWFAAWSDLIFHGQVWRLVTYAFLHDPHNIWHIVVNMLILWWVGREMEAFYGPREFLWLYLSGAVVSALCWAFMDYSRVYPRPMMVGASGAVMAVLAVYTFYNPRREVILYFIPMEMWLLLTLFVVSDAWSLLVRSKEPVAFAAHLGGVAYAFAFKTFDLRLKRLKGLLPRRGPKLRLVSPPDPPVRETPTVRPVPNPGPSPGPTWSPNAATSTRPATTAVVSEETLEAKLDEILVKIAGQGRESLTDDEKRILEEASRRARNRRSERI